MDRESSGTLIEIFKTYVYIVVQVHTSAGAHEGQRK